MWGRNLDCPIREGGPRKSAARSQPSGGEAACGTHLQQARFRQLFLFIHFFSKVFDSHRRAEAAAVVALISGAAVHWTAAAWLSLALSPPEGWVAVGRGGGRQVNQELKHL